MATSATELDATYWQNNTTDRLPFLIDNHGCLLTAFSLNAKGTTPHRWIVDMAFHEIGLNPHPHIFYHNPQSSKDNSAPLNICCQTCFKQYTVIINKADACKGQTHHLHTSFGEETIAAECCHCGLHVTATFDQAAIPQSLLYRIRTSRRPKVSSLTNAPVFLDTLETLIRILQGAAKPGAASINIESKVFTTKIALDADM